MSLPDLPRVPLVRDARARGFGSRGGAILPLAAALVLLAALSGCGIVRSTVGLRQARAAVSEAERAHAESSAVYEMTLAQEYLAKAAEEQSFNAYQVSEELAIKARAEAEKAFEVATKGRPRKSADDVVDKRSIEALPEQGEVEQHREQQESETKVLQSTGPEKVLQDDVDVLDEKKDDEKKDDSGSSAPPPGGSGGGGQ